MEPPGRGQKGYFQGALLKILLQQLPDYLATASHQKQNFWTKFYPVWTAAYEKLDPDDEQELADLEASYKEEVDSVQEYNKLEKKKGGAAKPKMCSRLTLARATDWTSSERAGQMKR
ncbi:hypothetical protein DFH08DRAFT_968467 [Mycena albidolilacea]|uniref:Uncharacterized protein n=1 Tax=Mycena albidolilacea TaxID=1033008 RepID=A0AAD7EJ16_9AGAR|nr:hypothetical protein DFH08DRAFT_968467 [Mycena albidolilacea]